MQSKEVDSAAAEFAAQYKLPSYEALIGPSKLDGEEGLNTNEGTDSSKVAGWAGVVDAPDPEPATTSRTRGLSAPAAADTEDWWKIPEAKMTPELRRDLVLLENRAHLDPKRFYKSSGTGRKRGQLPTRVQTGVVVAAAHEYLSGRLTNRERKKSFADEIFSDSRLMDNTRRRFAKVQESRQGDKRVIDPASRKIRKRGSRR